MGTRRVNAEYLDDGTDVFLARWRRRDGIPHDTATIEAWLHKNTSGTYAWIIKTFDLEEQSDLHSQQLGVRFSDPNEALEFKLRWC